MLRRAADSTVDQPQPARDLAIACNNLSYVLRNHDAAAAEKTAQEAIGILERLVNENPSRIQFQDDLALCYNNLAVLESRQERRARPSSRIKKRLRLKFGWVQSPGSG